MKKNTGTLKLTAIVSGTALLGAMGTSANAASLTDYENLGTAAQLRSDLITADPLQSFTSNTDIEFECGEGKCGEGKCGDHKKDEKKAETKETKDGAKKAEKTTKEGSSEMKKGEAKPAEKKTEMKEAPKD